MEPSPCLWDDVGDQVTGSQWVINWSKGEDVNSKSGLDLWQTDQQAKKMLANEADAPHGDWYWLPPNPNAPADIELQCGNFPWFEFAPVNQTPPRIPPVPARILAEYGLDRMLLPKPKLTTSPADLGFVNLGTYVWWNNIPAATVSETVTLPGSTPVTLVARLSPTVSVTGTGGKGFNTCNLAGNPAGSSLAESPPPATGPGVEPDCGVLWQEPSTSASLTVTLYWQVTWHTGTSTAFTKGNPVHGAPAAGIPASDTVGPMPVREIQAVNGT